MKQSSSTTAWPKVSFVTCTFNSEKNIAECLDSINNLDYPKNKIEVVIVDGESKDKTISIAKKYSFCTFISKKTDGPEIATALGYQKTTGEFVVNFPSDNVITESNWLKRMLQPLLDNPEALAAETLYYSYNKHDKILNRYFALFGMNDPIAFYMKKQDRAPYFSNGWHLPVAAIEKKDYFLVTFNEDNLPTVGANGFIIRKKYAKEISQDPMKFFHMDTCLDLVRRGHNKFIFVKNSIWHKTGEELVPFFKKRDRYAKILYLKKQTVRRYHLINFKKDKVRLFFYVIASLTFVEPTIQSIRGYIKIRDRAWFLHPIACFLTTIIYSYTIVSYFLFTKLKK